MSTRRRYASKTDVTVVRSRQQIEQLLIDHGAEGFLHGWNHEKDKIEFALRERVIRIEIIRPVKSYPDLETQSKVEQADRQRWRGLYLVVRAKLEAVESGLAIFDEEFLSYIVTASGRTVGAT